MTAADRDGGYNATGPTRAELDAQGPGPTDQALPAEGTLFSVYPAHKTVVLVADHSRSDCTVRLNAALTPAQARAHAARIVEAADSVDAAPA